MINVSPRLGSHSCDHYLVLIIALISFSHDLCSLHWFNFSGMLYWKLWFQQFKFEDTFCHCTLFSAFTVELSLEVLKWRWNHLKVNVVWKLWSLMLPYKQLFQLACLMVSTYTHYEAFAYDLWLIQNEDSCPLEKIGTMTSAESKKARIQQITASYLIWVFLVLFLKFHKLSCDFFLVTLPWYTFNIT